MKKEREERKRRVQGLKSRLKGSSTMKRNRSLLCFLSLYLREKNKYLKNTFFLLLPLPFFLFIFLSFISICLFPYDLITFAHNSRLEAQCGIDCRQLARPRPLRRLGTALPSFSPSFSLF